MNQKNLLPLLLSLFTAVLLFVPPPAAAKGIYTGNLTHIIGDVKQGQIQNVLDTEEKIDHVLDGFERLGCNGVRITIFPEGTTPDPLKFDYLYHQAKKRGFKIFANPAQHAGAQRIASRRIENPGPVKNDAEATRILIEMIRAFAAKYPCDWICPFNEDGKVGGPWTESQIDQVFGSLYRKVNGADLIGPCCWGIPASIDVLKNTEIKKYITVATTHNLGHNHNKWDEFIKLAKKNRLPVWDSEVNTHKKYADKPHRLHTALDAGVDGLVLYHAWTSYVKRDTGALTPLGRKVRELILKNPEQLDKKMDTYRPAEGDILFQSLQEGPFTAWIGTGQKPPYTHCGLLVKHKKQWMILEAYEQVQMTPIKDWTARGRNQSFEIFRLKGPYQKHIPALIHEAQQFLGKPCDSRYQMDDTALYNAELIYKAYKNAANRTLGELISRNDLKGLNTDAPQSNVIIPENLARSPDLKNVHSSQKPD